MRKGRVMGPLEPSVAWLGSRTEDVEFMQQLQALLSPFSGGPLLPASLWCKGFLRKSFSPLQSINQSQSYTLSAVTNYCKKFP